MFRNHLLYRLLIFDVCATAALVWAWSIGRVWPLFVEDTSRISVLIVAVFLVGKASLFLRVRKVSRLKNHWKAGHLTKITKPRSLMAKMAHLPSFVATCTLLGFAGTLIGMKDAIASLDPLADYAASIDLLKTGCAIALNTSIVGLFAGLWLGSGNLMLHTATVCLIEDAGA